jgi:hypothetical protein
MLSDLCKQLNNWFDYKRLFGTFTIEGGVLSIDGAKEGQYIRICDSVFNDGVYKYPMSGLKDETFDGAIWLMAVPDDVVALSKEIDDWNSHYKDFLQSPYQSESFGGYTYSKGSSTGSDGTGITWSDIFADRLRRWQKL